jgi:hypothetical protein
MFVLNDNLCYIYWFRFESSNLKWDLTIFILYLLIIIKKKTHKIIWIDICQRSIIMLFYFSSLYD